MANSGRGRPSSGGRGTRRFSEGGNPQADRLRVRVRTAKGRPLASTRWLERQLNDPYVAAAKREGYRSRAAYKLLELDDKHRLLKPGMAVIDLGAAPGGWTQVVVERVNARGDRPGPRGRVVGIDLTEVAPIPGATLLHQDFLDDTAPESIKAALAGDKGTGESGGAERADVAQNARPETASRQMRADLVSRVRADLVMSDMAAPATGHPPTDHLRIIGLCEAAAEFAREVLAPGGAFVAKVLRGGTEQHLLQQLKRDFAQVRHVKPPASRADSAEIYVVAQGFRGARE